jgi:membrane-bound lytic murein transglycosylase B
MIQAREKKVLEQREAEKRSIVSATKGQEKIYETQIKQQELSAAEIRNALFSLRDSTSKPVSFGTMYSFAQEASVRTGVRPSMILAILTEESNLGKNLGTGRWTVDMHPTRDRPIFKEICEQLGLDPDSMPVSKKPWYGWGGAMGPGQFIPSTWKQIVPRVARMTGIKTPNPWDPRTATFATAIYLMDAGADKQTRAAERLAAQRYLAGWANANKPAYQFYGNEVMELVDKYDSQIEVLK